MDLVSVLARAVVPRVDVVPAQDPHEVWSAAREVQFAA